MTKDISIYDLPPRPGLRWIWTPTSTKVRRSCQLWLGEELLGSVWHDDSLFIWAGSVDNKGLRGSFFSREAAQLAAVMTAWANRS